MIVHAIVPMKSLERAKSRLAGILTPAERRALVIEMLARVIHTLRDPAAHVAAIWLISADAVALQLGAAWGARPLREPGGDLNAALEQARRAAVAAGAEAMLVVPGDVPLITPADVRTLVTFLAHGADLALAPDAAGHGTNALSLRRAAAIPFRFGHESAARHLAEAAARGLHARRYSSPTIALDVDDPMGLARYRALVPLPVVRAVG